MLLACAATAGVGGGNFSSSMANISFFYPEGKKGLALGLNAAGGNLGVAVTQLLVPLVIIVGVPAAAVKLPVHQVHLAYAGLMWMPFIVARRVRRLALHGQPHAGQGRHARPTSRRCATPQTWVMSLLYIGTFGSFIGYSFALPLVIKNTFPEFLGAAPVHRDLPRRARLRRRADRLGRAPARRLAVRPRRRRAASRSACFVGHGRRDRRARSPASSDHSFAAVLRRLHGRSSCSPAWATARPTG